MRPARLLPVKFVGGLLALGSGMALGREGPSVQLGGAVGAAVADRIGRGTRDRQTFIAAGAGAGLAAAFNAPLAGLVFVLEEVQRDFRPLVFGATFIAAAMATVVSQFFSGPFPVFEVAPFPIPPLNLLAGFALVGVLCGVFGVLFNRSIVRGLDLFERVASGRHVALAGVVGAAAGLAAWFAPAMVGGGHDFSEMILGGDIALAAIPLWFAFRFALTVASYSTGAPGGVFAPMLVLGALVGLGVGEAAAALYPALVSSPVAFAVVGMAAFFAAVVRAPLTGLVLIVEMTGSYALMLPLLLACFCAFVVAESFRVAPLYEALLERDLARRGIALHTAPLVVEYEVRTGAPFAGRAVRELGLPRGCVIVRVRDGASEVVAHADTVLLPHQRVTVVIAPDAVGAHERLRAGLGLPVPDIDSPSGA
jgi:CIC family chloride channel protein